MNEATLKALKESIEKWEKRAQGDHTSAVGRYGCPLCALFHTGQVAGCCGGCPVYEKTGQQFCDESPYLDYLDESTNENAQREVDFLKSLLPAEEERPSKEPVFGWVDLDYLG